MYWEIVFFFKQQEILHWTEKVYSLLLYGIFYYLFLRVLIVLTTTNINSTTSFSDLLIYSTKLEMCFGAEKVYSAWSS